MKRLLIFIGLSFFTFNFISAQDLQNFFKTARTETPKKLKNYFKKGLTAKSKSKSGRTALMAAASAGNIKTFITLLANGADINQTDKAGRNALAIAKEYNHEDKIKAVLFVLNLINKNQIA